MRFSKLYLASCIAGALCTSAEVRDFSAFRSFAAKSEDLVADLKDVNTAVGKVNGLITLLTDLGPAAAALGALDEACMALRDQSDGDGKLAADEVQVLDEQVHAVNDGITQALDTTVKKASPLFTLGIEPVARIIVRRYRDCLDDYWNAVKSQLPDEDKTKFDAEFAHTAAAFVSTENALGG